MSSSFTSFPSLSLEVVLYQGVVAVSYTHLDVYKRQVQVKDVFDGRLEDGQLVHAVDLVAVIVAVGSRAAWLFAVRGSTGSRAGGPAPGSGRTTGRYQVFEGFEFSIYFDSSSLLDDGVELFCLVLSLGEFLGVDVGQGSSSFLLGRSQSPCANSEAEVVLPRRAPGTSIIEVVVGENLVVGVIRVELLVELDNGGLEHRRVGQRHLGSRRVAELPQIWVEIFHWSDPQKIVVRLLSLIHI